MTTPRLLTEAEAAAFLGCSLFRQTFQVLANIDPSATGR